MAVQICPICKKGEDHEVGSWVRCPRFAAPVCMEHCNECRFFSGYETSVVHCYEPNAKKESLEQRLKAETKQGNELKISYLNYTSFPFKSQ